MAYLIDIPIFTDDRGSLCVIERQMPFEIKRTYYIFNATGKRGGHRHKNTTQGAICLGGECEIYANNGKTDRIYKLNKNNQCLILEPIDWHTMDHFSHGAVLLIFASEYYDVNDYIYERYN